MDFGVTLRPGVLVEQPLLAVLQRPQLHILSAKQSQTDNHGMGEH